MKVLLVNPPYDIEEYYGKLSKIAFTFAPVGLLYLAASARSAGHEVKIYDFQVDEDDFRKIFLEFSPDITGITCQTALVYNTLKLAELIKSLKDIPVVAGGVHPSFRPGDLVSDKNIDFVIKGEGEIALGELIQAITGKLDLSQVKGLVYKRDGRITENPDRELLKDINTLPFPALDLVPIDKYHVSSDLYFGRRTALLATARGCPFRCSFCAIRVIFARTIRYRTLDNIFAEIDYYVNNHKIDSLFIIDDVFTLDKDRVRKFCDYMIERHAGKLSWWAQTRADCIDKDTLSLMKSAGCKILSFGVESGVGRLLKLINKDIDLQEIKKAVRLVKKSGISPRGSFILGLPTETLSDSLRTIFFALSNPFNRIKIGLATPYPGTELWELAVREGKIKDEEDWNRFTQMAGYTHHELPYLSDHRGVLELKALQIIGNFVFYFKPDIIWDIFKTYYRLGSLRKLFKSAKIFLNATIMSLKNSLVR
ncbi:MAG: radical SAM protein [Candidatus Omnitrophota bacterium]